jgi:hypothetical protein
MIDNIKTSLFNIEDNVAVETNNSNDNEEICVKISLDIIFEHFLTRVLLLTTSSNTMSMTILRDMARKMPPSTTSSTITLNSRIEVVTNRSNPSIQLLPILT